MAVVGIAGTVEILHASGDRVEIDEVPDEQVLPDVAGLRVERVRRWARTSCYRGMARFVGLDALLDGHPLGCRRAIAPRAVLTIHKTAAISIRRRIGGACTHRRHVRRSGLRRGNADQSDKRRYRRHAEAPA